jgi:hypothetical protein
VQKDGLQACAHDDAAADDPDADDMLCCDCQVMAFVHEAMATLADLPSQSVDTLLPLALRVGQVNLRVSTRSSALASCSPDHPYEILFIKSLFRGSTPGGRRGRP